MNVRDRRVFKSLQVHRVLALTTRQVLHLEITQHRRVITFRALLVVEIDCDRCVSDFANGDVTTENIFQHTATYGVVLETQAMIEPRTTHIAVQREDIAHAC